MFQRNGRARVCASLVVAAALTWSGCGGGPSGPSLPAVPSAVSPMQDAEVESQTPTLVIQNPKDFDAGQATFDFVVLDAKGEATVQQVTGVPAGTGQTQATLQQPLARGRAYQWKAVGRAGARTVESALATFVVGIACQRNVDPYGKSVVDFFVTACTRRVNRAPYLDPNEALGPPNARGANNQEERFSGIVSLGQEGYIVLDMGVCLVDRPGADVRVYQFVESEPVKVRVAATSQGPWMDIGTKSCGDGGLAVVSNHCDFDIASSGLRVARYVWVEDAENFPCEAAGSRTEGADIDAVEVLSVKP